MSNQDDDMFHENDMSNCKVFPASISLVMARLTWNIAKSLHMTKFYNKLKADLFGIYYKHVYHMYTL